MTSGTQPSGPLAHLDFGRTGHRSTHVIFGAAALGRMNQDRADAVLETLLEFEVNHIDTAAGYGDSELRMAPWLRQHRDRFFLATKTGDRSGRDARASLERSLERLGVDHVDLIQLHNLVEEDDWQTAHGPGGAVDALVQAREEGLTRFIGVTGHGLRIVDMHRRSLARFHFDSVLFPYNFVLWQNADYRRQAETLLSLCAERRIAAQTIKSMARRRWSGQPDAASPRFSWYEPVKEAAAIDRAARWVLSRPDIFLISSSDASLLRPTLQAATAAAAGAPAPAAADLEADVRDLAMQPLFDGGELERI